MDAALLAPEQQQACAHQLDLFYKLHDPSKVGQGLNLVRKYDIKLLSNALRQKYGDIPVGWDNIGDRDAVRVAPRPKPAQSNSKTSFFGGTLTRNKAGKKGNVKARKQGSNTARKQGSNVARKQGSNVARKQGSNAARKQGNNAARKQGSNTARKQGSNTTRKQGDNPARKVTKAAPPTTPRKKKGRVRINPDRRVESPNDARRYNPTPPTKPKRPGLQKANQNTSDGALDQTSYYFKSSNQILGSTKTLRSDGSQSQLYDDATVKDGRLLPPNNLLQKGGSQYQKHVSPKLLDTVKNTGHLKKYKDMQRAGMPQRMVENCMITDGFSPNLLFNDMGDKLSHASTDTMDFLDDIDAPPAVVPRAPILSKALLAPIDPRTLPPPPPPPPGEADATVQQAVKNAHAGKREVPRTNSGRIDPTSLKNEVIPSAPTTSPPPMHALNRLSRIAMGAQISDRPGVPQSRSQRLSKRLINKVKTEMEETAAPAPATAPAPANDMYYPEEVVAKYRRMVKAGLPMGAVENSMLRDGLDPALFNSNTDAAPAEPQAEPEPEAPTSQPTSTGAAPRKARSSRISSGLKSIRKSVKSRRSNEPQGPPRGGGEQTPQNASEHYRAGANEQHQTEKSQKQAAPARRPKLSTKLSPAMLEMQSTLRRARKSSGSSSGENKQGGKIMNMHKKLAGIFGGGETEKRLSPLPTGTHKPSAEMQEKHNALAGLFGAPAAASTAKRPASLENPAQVNFAEKHNALASLFGGSAAQATKPNEQDDSSSTAPKAQTARVSASTKDQRAPTKDQRAPTKDRRITVTQPDNQVWQEIWSQEHNRAYYYNPVTKESTWDMPVAPGVEVKTMNLEGGAENPWKVCWSTDFDQPYFFNQITGASVWELDEHQYQEQYLPKTENNDELVVAAFDFTPSNPQSKEEIRLVVGDMVRILDKSGDDGWWLGQRLKDGVIGLFPYEFTEWL